MLLQNATKDPKELNCKTKSGGVISVKFAGGEIKDIPDDVVAKLKTNPACMNWFRNKIIIEVKPTTSKSVKPAEIKTTETVVKTTVKKKSKKSKASKSFDDDLDL